MITKQLLLVLKNKANAEMCKTALPLKTTRGWLRKQVGHHRVCVKMASFKEAINMFTACKQNVFCIIGVGAKGKGAD